MVFKSKKLDRRDFLVAAGGGLASAALTRSVRPYITARWMLVYVGTYTSHGAEGIYGLKLDLASGELTKLGVVRDVVEPSFLTTDSQNHYVYAVNETNEYEGKPSGAVSAFLIEEDGGLRLINKVPSLGGSPCHITVSANDKFVLVANYMGGNVAVFPVRPDGGLGPNVDLKQHQGSGPNKDRQEAAHAHEIVLDAKNRFAFAVDLGIDKVISYKFDPVSGKLSPNSSFVSKPGAGPRHIALHPNGRFAYLINELDCTITAAAYDSKLGSLRELQTVKTLPDGFSGANTCAEIVVSPSGKHLYGSNRGHDSIVSFSIDGVTGKLTYIEHVSSDGTTPRNFTIDPTGKYLLAANQNSGGVTVFSVDKNTGRLRSTGKKVDIPAPVCLRIIPF